MAKTQPEDFRIDIAHEQSFRYIQAKQYDHNSRTRRLVITENNIPKKFTGKELVTLSLTINGNNYSNTTCKFGDDGFPYVTFTEDMLKYEGEVLCELRIWYSGNADESIINSDEKKDGVVTTFNFGLEVSKSILNRDRLVASSEFNILNDLIIKANAIPDLINQFNLSQEQINALIDQVQNDIADYTNQFSTMKTKYTNDFNALIQQINTDIASYKSEYNSLKSDITTLKTSVTTWYTTAQAAENTRIANETKRQTDTAKAIENCEKATANTNAAITGANDAKDNANAAATEAQKQGAYAQNQGDRVDMALQDFEFRLRTVDGGDLTDTTPAENIYDGGTL